MVACVAAATAGDTETLGALLAATPALALATSPSGVTAAAMAARKGQPATLAALLRAGADARAADDRGLSLLHHAALGRCAESAALALDAGADPYAPDANGKRAREIAAIFGAADVGRVLGAAEARAAVREV